MLVVTQSNMVVYHIKKNKSHKIKQGSRIKLKRKQYNNSKHRDHKPRYTSNLFIYLFTITSSILTDRKN